MSTNNLKGFDDEIVSNIGNSCNRKYNSKHVFSTRNNPICGITLFQWIWILSKYWIHIEAIYLFRFFFVTILAFINSILSAIESIYYSENIISTVVRNDDPRSDYFNFFLFQELKDDPVFVIGHPRTGTTLVHNLLSNDEKNFYFCTTFCAGFPSSFLWFENWGKFLFANIIDKTRPMDSMPLHFDLPQEDELAVCLLSQGTSYYMALYFMKQEITLRKFIDFHRDQGADIDDEKKWVQSFLYYMKKLTLRNQLRNKNHFQGLNQRLLIKSPIHTARIPLLKKLFPHCRFIYLHRDPYVVYQSAAHMADTTYLFSYFNTPSDEQITEYILWQFEYLFRRYSEAALMKPTGCEDEDIIDNNHEVSNNSLVANDIEKEVSPSTYNSNQRNVSSVSRRKGLAHDIIEIPYALLVSEPIVAVKAIYTHIHLHWDDRLDILYTEQCDILSTYQPNVHSHLSPDEKTMVYNRWRDYFSAFNYSK